MGKVIGYLGYGMKISVLQYFRRDRCNRPLHWMGFVAACAGVIAWVPLNAYGDGEKRDAGALNHDDNPADASLDDKRLPPVYPGEVVSDGKQKIKVWSTTGSLSTSPIPGAQNPPSPSESGLGVPSSTQGGSQYNGPPIGGVIVDRSERPRRRRIEKLTDQ